MEPQFKFFCILEATASLQIVHLIHLFIESFIHSFVCSFVRLFVYLLVRLLVRINFISVSEVIEIIAAFKAVRLAEIISVDQENYVAAWSLSFSVH